MATPTIAIIPSGIEVGTVYSVLPDNSTGDFAFTRASSKTIINASGLLETIATGLPALSFPLVDGVAGTCPTLLIETQTTNLVAYSESLVNWSNSGGNTLTSGLTSPNGDTSAYSILSGTGTSSRMLYTTPLSAVSTQHVLSMFVKQVDSFNTTYLRWSSSELSDNIATFAFDTEVLTNVSGNSTDLFVEKYPNGWYKVGFTFTTGATITSQQIQINRGANVTAAYWGVQIEQKAIVSSYVPTSGAIATRLADVSTVDLTPFTLTSITETIEGVEQTPITVIPSTYTMPNGAINKIIMV